MNLLDTLLSLVAPHECLGCASEGRLLCEPCATALPSPPHRCYRCRRLTPNSRTCASCRSVSRLYAVSVTAVYDGPAKELVWRLKFGGARAAAQEIARLMARQAEARGITCIVPVPTATRRVRHRGYDQAVLIARAVSQQTGIPVQRALRRTGQAHQVGAGRRQRLRQLRGAFRVVTPLPSARVLLIDDVVTTGATLEAAAAALRRSGTPRVEAAVFAQP